MLYKIFKFTFIGLISIVLLYSAWVQVKYEQRNHAIRQAQPELAELKRVRYTPVVYFYLDYFIQDKYRPYYKAFHYFQLKGNPFPAKFSSNTKNAYFFHTYFTIEDIKYWSPPSYEELLFINNLIPNGHNQDIQNATWQRMLELDMRLIDFLILQRFRRSKGLYSGDSVLYIGYDQVKKKSPSRRDPYRFSDKIMALYMISALYHEDYEFADHYSLYNADSIERRNDSLFYTDDEITRSFWASKKTLYLEQAWDEVMKWRHRNIALSLSEIRAKNDRPFGESGIYWTGEPSGPVKSIDEVFSPPAHADLSVWD